MEGNEEEDLLLSSFSLCHSLNSHLSLSLSTTYNIVHYCVSCAQVGSKR
jgi:hypothetical protein